MQKEGAGKFGNHSTKGRLGGTARAGKAAATKAFRAARGVAGARRRAQAAESIAARAAAGGAAVLHGLHMGSGASDGDDDEPVLATPPRAAANRPPRAAAHRPRAAAGMGWSGEDDRAAPVPRAHAAPVLGAGAAMESSDEDAAAGMPPPIARVRGSGAGAGAQAQARRASPKAPLGARGARGADAALSPLLHMGLYPQREARCCRHGEQRGG